MTRRERLNKLAAFCRDFNRLLEDVPEEEQEEVRMPFCNAAGHYLEVMEEVTDGRTST